MSTQKITTETNGATYPQFTSHGTGYDTLVGVAIRLAQLTQQDAAHGPSDGRETERQAILADLHAFAVERGAEHPEQCITLALRNIAYVNGMTLNPVLSVGEEITIAANNTNQWAKAGTIFKKMQIAS